MKGSIAYPRDSAFAIEDEIRYGKQSAAVLRSRIAVQAGFGTIGVFVGQIAGPVEIQIEYTTRNALGVDAHLRPGAEIVDPRSIRYHGKDFMEAWTRSQRP